MITSMGVPCGIAGEGSPPAAPHKSCRGLRFEELRSPHSAPAVPDAWLLICQCLQRAQAAPLPDVKAAYVLAQQSLAQHGSLPLIHGCSTLLHASNFSHALPAEIPARDLTCAGASYQCPLGAVPVLQILVLVV